MRLRIIDKRDLSAEQARELEERLRAPEHAYDSGPRTTWGTYVADTLYAFVLADSGLPVGIAEASGTKWAVNAGWWIDSKYRGLGYGSELIDLLARRLKERGYTGTAHITVDTFRGEYHQASSRMRDRFYTHFDYSRTKAP